MNGVVVERNLALGQVVQPADALFVVADLGKLWATALVPEQQVRFVKQGQTVALEIPALGGAKREQAGLCRPGGRPQDPHRRPAHRTGQSRRTARRKCWPPCW
jgi:multidrug efflux pump subunit AcrA (membrane-fusion protein)